MSEGIWIAIVGAISLLAGSIVTNLFNAPKIRDAVKKEKIDREGALQKQIDDLRVDNTTLFDENKKNREESAARAEENRTLRIELDSLKGRLDRTQQENENFRKTNVLLKEAEADKQKEIDRKNAEIIALNKTIIEKNIEIEGKTAVILALRNDIAELKNQMAAVRGNTDRLTQRLNKGEVGGE